MKILNRPVRSISIAIVFCSALLTPVTQSGAQEQNTSQCSIEILFPKPHQVVAVNDLVKGKAHIPPGKYLWVFAHAKALRLWWPQGEGPAKIAGGNWKILVFYGTPQDIGRDFEISAAVLGPAENEAMLKWFKKAKATNLYPGIRFPKIVSGCPIPRVTVTKGS